MLLAASLAASVLAGCAVPPSAAVGPQPAPTPVITQAAPAPLPEPSLLAAKLKKVSAKGISKTSLVITSPSGATLASRAANTPLTPASTMKLITAMAALDTLGAERKFATSVVRSGGSGIVLVGGGDPLLTDKTSKSGYKAASLQKLASLTVARLKSAKQNTVQLSYDASLFSGPTFSPHWKKKWRSYEAKVAALELNSGKLSSWRADPNPPLTAATAFAKRLRKAGIKVTAIRSARASGTEIARVESVPLAKIIKRTLLISDNVAAETMSRHAALANGKPGSFAGASANVSAWLSEHGLSANGQRILDGSGLSPKNKLTTAVLVKAMRIAVADQTYSAVVSGLPLAHKTGTLKDRFDDKVEKPGRGNVHAKTGTLRGVAGLVGYLTTADGALLVFAELANSGQSVSYRTLYNWLDRTAAATVTCGCR